MMAGTVRGKDFILAALGLYLLLTVNQTKGLGEVDQVAFTRGAVLELTCRLGDPIPGHSYTWYAEGEKDIEEWCQSHHWYYGNTTDYGNKLTLKPLESNHVRVVMLYCRENTTGNVVRLQKLERQEFTSLLSGSPYEETQCPLHSGYQTTLSVRNIAEITVDSLECAWTFTPRDPLLPRQRYRGDTHLLTDEQSQLGEYKVRCSLNHGKAHLMMTFIVESVLAVTSKPPLSTQYCIYSKLQPITVPPTQASLSTTTYSTKLVTTDRPVVMTSAPATSQEVTSMEHLSTHDVTSQKISTKTSTSPAAGQSMGIPSSSPLNRDTHVQGSLQIVSDTLENFSAGSLFSGLERLKNRLLGNSSPTQKSITKKGTTPKATPIYREPEALASVGHIPDAVHSGTGHQTRNMLILIITVMVLLVIIIVGTTQYCKQRRHLRNFHGGDQESGEASYEMSQLAPQATEPNLYESS